MVSRISSRDWVLLGVLGSVVSLAYFYALDRVLFSSRHFLPIYSFLLTVCDVDTAWAAVAVVLLAALWRWPEPVHRLVALFGAAPATVSLVCAGVLAAGCLGVFHQYPLCMDEYAAVFQSKVFGAGRLTAQLPPALIDRLVPPSFNGSFLFASSVTGQGIEGYWPGFALLLAPFERLGVSWLCNPLISGAAVYLIFKITLQISNDRRAAGWAMLFALASSAFLAYGMSYYSMQAHLAANLLFAYLLFEVSPRRAFAAGLVGSLALLLHNPMPHALFAAPWLVSLALQRRHWPSLATVALGYLPGLCVFAYWLVLRGAIVLPDPDALAGVGSGVFGLPDGVTFDARVSSTIKLSLWAAPCLLMFAAFGVGEYRHDRRVRLLAWSAALTFAGYWLVRIDQGHGWGNRYFHSAWGVLPVLAGLALGRRHSDAKLVSFAGACAVLGALLLVPLQLHQIETLISRQLERFPARQGPGNNVVFVKTEGASYVADLVQIDPFLRDRDLLLVSQGAQRDGDFMHRNWPEAVRTDRNFYMDVWHLGETDVRRPVMINPTLHYAAPAFTDLHIGAAPLP